jgi:hypothetical protein
LHIKKNNMRSVVFISAMLLLAYACNKKEIVHPTSANQGQGRLPNNVTARDPNDPTKYYYNGNEIDWEEFVETDSTQWVGLDSLNFLIFSGEGSLLAWAHNSSSDPQNLKDFKNWIIDKLGEINAFYAEADARNIDRDDDEAMRELYEEMYPNRIEGGKTSSALYCLYKNSNYSGGSLCSLLSWPTMPSGWNNVVTSWWNTGVGAPLVLCDGTWWGSPRLWWWGPGGWNGTVSFAFNDRTSSSYQ